MKKVMFMLFLLFVGVIVIVAQDIELVDGDPGIGFSWLWPVASAILVALSTFFKTGLNKFKGRAKRAVTFGSETIDVLEAGTNLAQITLNAAEDHVFTTEEKAAMKAAAENWKTQKAEAVAAWKYMIAKDEPV